MAGELAILHSGKTLLHRVASALPRSMAPASKCQPSTVVPSARIRYGPVPHQPRLPNTWLSTRVPRKSKRTICGSQRRAVLDAGPPPSQNGAGLFSSAYLCWSDEQLAYELEHYIREAVNAAKPQEITLTHVVVNDKPYWYMRSDVHDFNANKQWAPWQRCHHMLVVANNEEHASLYALGQCTNVNLHFQLEQDCKSWADMYGDTITPSKVILHDDFLGLEYSKPALLQDVMAGVAVEPLTGYEPLSTQRHYTVLSHKMRQTYPAQAQPLLCSLRIMAPPMSCTVCQRQPSGGRDCSCQRYRDRDQLLHHLQSALKQYQHLAMSSDGLGRSLLFPPDPAEQPEIALRRQWGQLNSSKHTNEDLLIGATTHQPAEDYSYSIWTEHGLRDTGRLSRLDQSQLRALHMGHAVLAWLGESLLQRLRQGLMSLSEASKQWASIREDVRLILAVAGLWSQNMLKRKKRMARVRHE